MESDESSQNDRKLVGNRHGIHSCDLRGIVIDAEMYWVKSVSEFPLNLRHFSKQRARILYMPEATVLVTKRQESVCCRG